MCLKASLLLAVYNRPAIVHRTLLGLTRQSCQNFEIIVCDDGSGQEIKDVLSRFEETFKDRLIHVWQEHRGFRKCRILNEGILHARSDYLIFLDSDCIPHREFVNTHINKRQPGFFLVGRRLIMGKKLTEQLSDNDILSGKLERLYFLLLHYNHLRHISAGLYMPWLHKLRSSPLVLKGCNFSCFLKDMWQINGFDEQFDTPGTGEDTDIERRFRLIGLKPVSVKYSALCYHQYHPFVERVINKNSVENTSCIASYGLKEHSAESSRIKT
jgi:glycosyltransferase involved in cell wall biosynthesis